jgi:carboxypeptidase Q
MSLRRISALVVLACAAGLAPVVVARVVPAVPVQAPPAWLEPYRSVSQRIIASAVANDSAWKRLAELGDSFGPRLTGSPALAQAIGWAVAEMKKDGLENVHTERVMVPHWVRGAESLEIVSPSPQHLVVLGLGGSIATPAAGIAGEVLVVHSFADLDENAARAKGHVVLFNVPFTNYGETVQYRASGASRAAKYGAVAALVRSVGPIGLRTPHTGAMRYDTDAPRIPAAAIPAEDAAQLQRMADRGTRIVVRLKMDDRTLPDVESANVVAELRGRDRPEEVVVISGHLDSWDVGTGSTDDGGGCVAVWEALRVLKQLDLRPRRTIRVVLWVNEETEQRGGYAYRDQHRDELARHVLMLESDSGVFKPLGFGFSGNEAARAAVVAIGTLLAPIGADHVTDGGGGADIGPSVQAGKVPSMSLSVDGTAYFQIHHTPADTVDRIDPTELAHCVAAIGVMSYVVADMPQPLGRTSPRS